MKEEVLYFCSRCHRKFEEMGEILEWGKTYPAFILKEKLKNGEWKWTKVKERREIKKALCKECMTEVSKKQYDLQDSPLLKSPL